MRVVHPDLLDKPVQGEFVIQKVLVGPAYFNLSIPRNYEHSFDVTVATGSGTSLTNLRLEYRPEDQADGKLPEGVFVTLGDPRPFVGEKKKVSIPVRIWANNLAAASGRLLLRVVSDESSSEGWGTVPVNTAFSLAKPVLKFSPNRLETGVVQSDMVTETIHLKNSGLAALEEVQLRLKQLDGRPAPSWLHLGVRSELGDIEVGEQKDVPISFSPNDTIVPGNYQFLLEVASNNYPTTPIYLFVTVNEDGLGGALFKVSDIYTGTTNAAGELIEGLSGAKISLQNEATLESQPLRITDSLGEVSYSDLPAGWYKYRITATNHQERIGRIMVKPGIVATSEVFLDYNLVTVSWEVKEITIEDRYEIVLNTTFESDVPAAVVVARPTSITLPKLKAGMVFNGEFTLTNHGIVRADDLQVLLPASDEHFRYELLEGVPDHLGAGETITIAYRVTCLKSLEQAEGSGGGCGTYSKCITIPYSYTCANQVKTGARSSYCFTRAWGECSSTSGSGGGGGIGGVGGGGVHIGGGSGSVSSPVPMPKKLAGAKCLGNPNCPYASKPTCPTGNCPDADTRTNTGSQVDNRHRQYQKDLVDMSVDVPGGKLSVRRFYEGDAWSFTFERDNLRFSYNGQGEIEEITRTGVTFTHSSTTPTLYRYRSERIEKSGSGFRWWDRSGNWMEYDSEGRLLSYGLRNETIASVLYEGDRVTGWLDRNDDQVFWFSYTGDDLTEARDATGRKVSYSYQNGLLRTVTDLRGQVSRYSYSNGRLSRVEEPGGKVRNISYNKFGHVVSVLDDDGIGHHFEYDYDKGTREYYTSIQYPSGKVKEVWYNEDGEVNRVDINGTTIKSVKRSGRTEWVTDERGYTTRYDKDEWDNTIRTVYPDGSIQTRSYSRPWNLLTEVNRSGVITRYEYDGDGRRTAMVEAAGTAVERRTEYSYSPTGKLVTSSVKSQGAGADAVTRFSYDAHDRLLSITDPEGRVTSFSDYHPSGNPRTVTDGRGKNRYYSYDDAGNLLTVHDHDHQLISKYSYDAAGNRSSVINGYLKEYKLVYDAERRLISSEDPLGEKVSRDYSPAGKPITVTDQLGNVTRYQYDSYERLSKVIDPEGNEISYTYTTPGGCSSCSGGINLASAIRYPTFTRELSYDSRKRLVAQKDVYSQKERLTSYEYDERGNLTKVIDPEGNTTSYNYDSLGRKIQETDSLGNITSYTYDNRDNLVKLVEPTGATTWFSYDLSNRLIRETRPLQQELVYSYDQAGNLATMIDGNGRKTRYSYDNQNRLVKSEIYPSASAAAPEKTITYSYNLAGSLTGYDDGVTSASYSYDDLQRRTGETVNYPGFSLSHAYSYDATGRKQSYTDPAGRVRSFSYDKAGRPTAVDLGTAGMISYNGYTWTRPSKLTLPGGSRQNFGYDGLLQLSSISALDPAGNPLQEYSYRRSLSGQISARSTEHGDYSYGYDPLYRLTSASSPTTEESYGYDGSGNRTASIDDPAWNYNQNNQLRSYGNQSFVYDDHGNMIERTVGGAKTTFTYTPDNHLAAIHDNAGGTTASYGYDPFGRRLWKEVSGTRTYYHYNDEGLAGEYDANGQELRTYGYAPGSPWSTNPLFVQIGDVYYYYINDHLGTPQKIVAANGAIVWQAVYDAFGKATIQVEQIVNNLRFPGQFYDAETGLHYNWHRFYDPETGRYVSGDPIGLGGGMNYYVYSLNDSVNSIDPFGLNKYGPLIPRNRYNTPRRPPVEDPNSPITSPPGTDVDYPYMPDTSSSGTGEGCSCALVFHSNVYWTCVGDQVFRFAPEYMLAFAGMLTPSGFTQITGATFAIAMSWHIGEYCHNKAIFCDKR